MTSRAASALLCALVATLAPRAARASPADAFEHKVKPVSGQLYRKAGKVELTLPAAGLSLNDPFFTKYVAGAKLGYHLNESFSIGLTGALASASPTGSTAVCPLNQGCRAASTAQLNQVPGQVKWLAGVELAFSPVYGKLNVFAEKAVHFDLSLLAGADFVTYRDVLGAVEANAGATPGTASSPGGHVGLGARLFLARFLALRLEVRDIFYSVPRLATGSLQAQLLAEAGLSFFIPVAGQDAP
jgi:outer membrane beta-barrel protein